MISSIPRRVAAVLGIGAIYILTAKFGFSLAFVAEQVTVVGPPAGLAIASIALLGFGVWPGVFLGAFVANVTGNEPVLTAIGIAAGNTLEAVVAVALMKRISRFDKALARIRDVFALILLGAGAGCAVGATISVASLCAGGVQPWNRFGALWFVWWLGDGLGTLIVAPMLLTLFTTNFSRQPARRWEAVGLGAALILASAAVFAGRRQEISARSIEYVVFPMVIWAALRFGPRGAACATFLISAIAVWGTSRGVEPIVAGDPAGNPVYVQLFVAVVAITGLVLAAAISQRREQYAVSMAVIEGTTDSVFVKDSLGRYLMINSAGASFIGKPPEMILGQDDSGLFSEETAARLMKQDRHVMESGETETIEETVTAGNASRIYLSTKGPYRDSRGRIIGVIGVSKNITELKRISEELRENDKRKDESLAMLAHELRNPMAPLRLAADLMKLDPERAAEQNVQDVIARQVKKLGRLVDDLLDVSRLTRGKVELQRMSIDVRVPLRSAAGIIRPAAAAKGQHLEMAIPETPVVVYGDALRLEQVFSNLLNNASKFAGVEGSIKVCLREEQGEAVIGVSDNGAGIPREFLSRVFDIFTQGDGSSTRAEGGLGIGLTVVRSIVLMHGGRVEAFSEGLGRGATFTIRLPMTSE